MENETNKIELRELDHGFVHKDLKILAYQESDDIYHIHTLSKPWFIPSISKEYIKFLWSKDDAVKYVNKFEKYITSKEWDHLTVKTNKDIEEVKQYMVWIPGSWEPRTMHTLESARSEAFRLVDLRWDDVRIIKVVEDMVLYKEIQTKQFESE